MDLDSQAVLEAISRLLDAATMAECFATLPALRGDTVRTCELASLWIKPGRHFNVCYSLGLAQREGGLLLASAFLLPEPRAQRVLAEARPCRHAAPVAGDCRGCATGIVDGTILLQLFPFDYRLPALPECLDAHRVAAALANAASFVGCEPSGYRPGMRCQIRYWSTAGTVAYGKVAVEKSPGGHANTQEKIRTGLAQNTDLLLVAKPFGYIEQLHLHLVSALPGESLHELIRGGGATEEHVALAARAIAEFHKFGIAEIERVYTPDEEIELVRGWIALATRLYPGLASALQEKQDFQLRSRPELGSRPTLIHRDFYDKQLLCSGRQMAVLDLDTVCHGDMELDLGNFCAHLILRGLQWGCLPRCRQFEQRFLDSYPGDVAEDRLAWYRRSTLLRLACVYAMRPHWHHLAPALIEEAGH